MHFDRSQNVVQGQIVVVHLMEEDAVVTKHAICNIMTVVQTILRLVIMVSQKLTSRLILAKFQVF